MLEWTITGEHGIGLQKKEYLLKYLGITPGSVSPFALLNDK